MARSEAQKAADSKYEEKRAGKPRLPSGYLTEAENELLVDMAKIHGTKKAAIFAGLKLLKEKSENS